MFVYETNSPVVFLVDFRLASDASYDYENDTTNSVYRLWGAASKYVSKQDWARLTKAALLDVTDTLKFPENADKGTKKTLRGKFHSKVVVAKAAMDRYLKRRQPKLIVVLQSRSASARKNKEIEGVESESDGTLVWDMMKGPGPMSSVFGTIFESPYGPCMAIPNPLNYEFVYEELIRRWLVAALAFGEGALPLLTPERNYFRRDEVTAGLARIRRNTMLSIDLEFSPALDIIMAIGISDGVNSVSVPWDSFAVGTTQMIEPGRTEGWETTVKDLLKQAPSVCGHNYIGADLPYLRARGLFHTDVIYDTWIMHGLAYRQYRHGLQECVAQNFLVHPWKVQFKLSAEGLVPDDPQYWTSAPLQLREYNCFDAFYTHKLALELIPKVGL